MSHHAKSQILILFALVIFFTGCRETRRETVTLGQVTTLAGAGIAANEKSLFGEAFGVAVGEDETVYVSDGERGRIVAVDKSGAARIVAGDLHTPSGIAIDKNGALIIAETGAHVIRRLNLKTGASDIIAGALNQAGFADGARDAARFDAPIGVAIDDNKVIFVTDSFNDAVRRIEPDGEVKTVFGSPIKIAKASEEERLKNNLDTPCGILITPKGFLVIADTGNNRVRVLTPNGELKTLEQRGQAIMTSSDAMPEFEPSTDAEFQEPIGVAIDKTGTIYVAEAGANRIARVAFNMLLGGSSDNKIRRKQLKHIMLTVSPFAGHISILSGASERYGFADGSLEQANFARPHGLALTDKGELIVADSDNKLLRFIGDEKKMRGRAWTAEEARGLTVTVSEFRARAAGRWNHPPFDRPREIAATFGEVRGSVTNIDDARFHNGIDIPGAYGETVYAMRDETVLRPVAVEGVNGARERLRLPQLGYIHLRIGRDKNDVPFDESKFQIVKDVQGKVARVRVRRGTRISAGERIGTLNNQNHTHLIAGVYGDEMNGFAALELPGIKDTIAPTIEAVTLVDANGTELKPDAQTNSVKVNGNISIIARCFDRMDGGAERRRLGVYKLGYQILRVPDDLIAVRIQPLNWTLTFDRLPVAARAGGYGARTVYAAGSQAGYSPNTIYNYIVTNTLRDGITTEDFWRASAIENGAYVVRVFAEDFFGNRSMRALKVEVVK